MEEVVDEENLEYVKILRALMELPFQVGKGLLADFLRGDYKNKSVIKNKLDELYTFDTLSWNKDKIYREIDKLTANGMIELSTSDYNRFIKVLKLTIKGRNEINNPTMEAKQLKNKVEFKVTKVTAEDREKFEALDSFLNGFNDEQKKAMISEAARILCVADSFDAMASDRAYRNKMEKSKVLDIIKENSGTQFDPEAVTAFLKVADQELPADF